MKNIAIIGIGMGNPETLTLEGKRYIDNADVLIGAKRMLETITDKKKLVFASYDSKTIAEYIATTDRENYAILMSGDTGFYSGTNNLLPLLQEYNIRVIPGISSLSYFCAKLCYSWEDAYLLSLHGRSDNIVLAVREHKKTFVLTDGRISDICSKLYEAGLGDVEVCVGENLSYDNERIIKAKAKELIGQDFASISVMLIHNLKYEMEYRIGIEDDEFIRGDIPMTKSEVRAITISKLGLKDNSIVYDIGAGTGSVSIEMALIAKRGRVYAIEQKEEAIHLIEKNMNKFTVDNLEIINGLAPLVMEELPKPDIAFIGGSKGNMEEIIRCLITKNSSIQIVVNAIAIETLTETLDIFKASNFEDIQVVQVTIAKTKQVGNYNMLMGQNPVFIISGRGKTT